MKGVILEMCVAVKTVLKSSKITQIIKNTVQMDPEPSPQIVKSIDSVKDVFICSSLVLSNIQGCLSYNHYFLDPVWSRSH